MTLEQLRQGPPSPLRPSASNSESRRGCTAFTQQLTGQNRGSFHKGRIEYYPPRGDAKEGWDYIDIFGWLADQMQIEVNFLCRDSILAAPLALDIVLFLDLAQRAGMRGIQECLSFHFKAPRHAPEVYPEHDIFVQLMKLKITLRWMRGEDLITHLGLEYYD